jgi:phospholipid-translocating ATPase
VSIVFLFFSVPWPDGDLSWTIMTWAVVVGSSVVMLIWVVIYSFFPSIDFVDEVVILYGNIQFWATVLLTVLIALGRCLTEFVWINHL